MSVNINNKFKGFKLLQNESDRFIRAKNFFKKFMEIG